MLGKITIGIYIVAPLLHMLAYPTFGLLSKPLQHSLWHITAHCTCTAFYGLRSQPSGMKIT